MHEKIGPHHLVRKAILYVRQSSDHQVLYNRENSTLQSAIRDRLMALGWTRQGKFTWSVRCPSGDACIAERGPHV